MQDRGIVIETLDLAFGYADAPPVLDRLNLSVHAGERVALLGSNGAGKSTLLLLLTGFLQPSRGQVRLFGERLSPANARELRMRCGLLFQDPDDQLFCPSVADDVAFGPRNQGCSGPRLDDRVREALDVVGLWNLRAKDPSQLSQGEKKRAALATVLAMKPELLLLDEPTDSLDPASCAAIAKTLAALEKTMIVVTQDLLLAASLCTRAVALSGGGSTLDEPMEALLASPESLERSGLPWAAVGRLCARYGWAEKIGARHE